MKILELWIEYQKWGEIKYLIYLICLTHLTIYWEWKILKFLDIWLGGVLWTNACMHLVIFNYHSKIDYQSQKKEEIIEPLND